MTVQPFCRVRLTDDAIADIHRIIKKDPQIARDIFARMILLQRSTQAGRPLLGDLVPFGKLVVGNRYWRIVWREAVDDADIPVLEIAEVWAIGAYSDGEIYVEMNARIDTLKSQNLPETRPLADFLQGLGVQVRIHRCSL